MISPNTTDQTVSIDGSKRQKLNQYKNSPGGHHHKPKRAKVPRYFREWDVEDRIKYNQTSIFLRLAKATQKQCQYYRMKSSSGSGRKIGFWSKVKGFFVSPPSYNKELLDFHELKKHYKPVPKGISVDLPPFQ